MKKTTNGDVASVCLWFMVNLECYYKAFDRQLEQTIIYLWFRLFDLLMAACVRGEGIPAGIFFKLFFFFRNETLEFMPATMTTCSKWVSTWFWMGLGIDGRRQYRESPNDRPYLIFYPHHHRRGRRPRC